MLIYYRREKEDFWNGGLQGMWQGNEEKYDQTTHGKT